MSDHNVTAGFYARMKRVRQKTGLSQKEMASELHIKHHCYAKYEQGLNLPSYKVLHRITQKYDVTLDWLVFNRGPENYSTSRNTAAEKERLQKQVKEQQQAIGDLDELIAFMDENPMFKHKVLGYFYRYKAEKAGEKLPETEI